MAPFLAAQAGNPAAQKQLAICLHEVIAEAEQLEERDKKASAKSGGKANDRRSSAGLGLKPVMARMESAAKMGVCDSFPSGWFRWMGWDACMHGDLDVDVDVYSVTRARLSRAPRCAAPTFYLARNAMHRVHSLSG
jgi:hypothetical protein